MADTKAFLKSTDWLDMKTIPWHTPEGQEIDIDTMADWRFAEYLMGER